MTRGLVLVLVLGMLFSLSGCTMNEIMGVQEEEQAGYELKPNLSVNENHVLKTWRRAAELADEVGDSTTAVLYYTRIADYFPDTKEGQYAKKRINEISGKPKKSIEENSL